MTIYILSSIAYSGTAIEACDGVQGVFTTEDKAREFMLSLWDMYNEVFDGYDKIDDWTQKFYTDKATYIIECMQLDYMMDE